MLALRVCQAASAAIMCCLGQANLGDAWHISGIVMAFLIVGSGVKGQSKRPRLAPAVALALMLLFVPAMAAFKTSAPPPFHDAVEGKASPSNAPSFPSSVPPASSNTMALPPPAPRAPLGLVRRVERRRLAQVSTVENLRSHLTAQTAVIELAAGTYLLGGTQLSIAHNVEIRAAVPGTVSLDAGGASRVIVISSGIVTLSGLNITGGRTVCCCFLRFPALAFCRTLEHSSITFTDEIASTLVCNCDWRLG